MNAANLLRELDGLGIRLQSNGDRLRYHPRSAVSPELLARLKANKDALLELLERYEERVAIMEYDGGLSRDEAERSAWESCMNPIDKEGR